MQEKGTAMPAATLFGRFLRAFRKRAGLGLPTIAASLHVAPATISRIETGRQNPPEDPAFYERLRAVPGFTPAEVTLLREAHEADKYIWDLENLKGGGGKTTLDLARIEVAEDLALIGARVLVNIGKIEAHAHDAVIEYIAERNRELPYSKLFLTLTGEVILMFELALPELIQPTMQAPQAAPTPVGEAESLPDISDHGIIPSPMPAEKGENGDSLTKHISDLQSQARLGSERSERLVPYPHENVVFHVAQLRTETLGQEEPQAGSGIIYERSQTPKTGTPEAGAAQAYEVVPTLRQAAEKTGIPLEEIMTTRDIQAEWNINR
jgi:transcriptional regulator with XRE-family HTH domain